MRRRPPLLEVWHWSWLDPHWNLPLSWWLAWDQAAIPVGGSDWHRPGADAPPGRPTTWAECAGDGPGAVLRPCAVATSPFPPRTDGPLLYRRDHEFLAVDADGLTLAGQRAPARGSAATGPAWNPTPARTACSTPPAGTLALCP